jgi:hypothetical protein
MKQLQVEPVLLALNITATDKGGFDIQILV